MKDIKASNIPLTRMVTLNLVSFFLEVQLNIVPITIYTGIANIIKLLILIIAYNKPKKITMLISIRKNVEPLPFTS